MSRNAQVVAFLAVVFAAALVMLFLDPEPREGALVPTVERDSDGRDSGQMQGAGTQPPPADRIERVSGDVSDPEAELLASGGATMRIRVLDDVTSEPIPNAVIHVVDADDREREELLEKFNSEPDAADFLRKNGVSVRSDGKGEALVAQPKGWVIACALKGELFGFGMIGIEQPAQLLELRMIPDVTLHMRVVDEQGQGLAGIPVALQTRANNWSQSGSKRVTDANGRAAFPHAQVRLASVPSRSSSWLAVALPSKPMAEVRIDPEAEDLEEEKVVTLPTGGKVRVRVLNIDGRQFDRPVEVNLQSYEPTAGEPKNFQPHAKRGHTATTSKDGEALFDRVGLGMHLVAGAQLDGSQAWFVGTGPGPQKAGEETVIEIRQNVLRPELVFQVLDPDGEPLAGVRLNCVERSISTNRSRDRSRTRTTDSEGILRYVLSSGPLGQLSSRTLEVRYRPSRGEPEWRASVDLSQDYPLGTHDLGTLQMGVPQLIAAGTVTSPDGDKVGGAQVRLYSQREDSRPGRIRWRFESGSETQSAPDGSFKIYGPPSKVAMELRATHPDYLQGTAPATVGVEDHTIVLEGGRHLSGKVLADDPEMYDHLSVSFYPENSERGVGRSWSRGSRRVEVEPDGSFQFTAMQAQTGYLQVSDERNSIVLYQIPAVEPWTDGTLPDGRMDPIDLRGRIDIINLSFTDVAGNVVKQARFSVSVPGSEEAWWTVARSGEAELYAPAGGVDLFVRTNGFREQEVLGVSGTRTIRLYEAIPLRFELRPSSLARDYDLELRVRSVADGPRIQPSSLRFGDDAVVEATAPKPGPIHAYLRIRWKNDEGRTQSRYVNFGSLGRRLNLDIRDGGDVQTITIDVDRSDIEAAIGN